MPLPVGGSGRETVRGTVRGTVSGYRGTRIPPPPPPPENPANLPHRLSYAASGRSGKKPTRTRTYVCNGSGNGPRYLRATLTLTLTPSPPTSRDPFFDSRTRLAVHFQPSPASRRSIAHRRRRCTRTAHRLMPEKCTAIFYF
jgi:hypothetical protein